MVSAAQIFKALLVSFVLAFSAYAVSKLNLFGLESASDRVADQIYQRITAADYGRDRAGQKAVSVVYLDETSIENLKGYGWNRFPPTFDQQWTMLDDVLQSGGAPPAAVFVDFVYMGEGGPGEGFDNFIKGVAAATRAQAWAGKPGCNADPLIKIACIVHAGGTPMIFAKPSPADLALFTNAQRAIDRVAVMAPALVQREAYPLITSYSFSGQARLGVHGFDVSPAMAMYTAYCVRQPSGCGVAQFQDLRLRARAALAGRRVQSPALTQVFDAPMDVVWGSRPDPDYLAMTKAVSGQAAPCRGAGSGWRERLVEQMTSLRGPGANARQECPYTLSLGYDRMVAGTGLSADNLKRLLAGRMVMVGGQFHASGDWVDSPVHGQAPGVQFHAMALDNLIEAGPEYRRNANMMLDSDMVKSLLIAALAFCGVLGVMIRNSLLDRAVESGMEPRLRSAVYGPLYLILFSTSLGVIAFTTWIGVAYAHRSAMNWIGLSTVALGFLFYATRQTLPADVCGSLEKHSVIAKLLRYGRFCFSALKFEEDRLLRPRPSKSQSPVASDTATRVQEISSHAESEHPMAGRGLAAAAQRSARPEPRPRDQGVAPATADV